MSDKIFIPQVVSEIDLAFGSSLIPFGDWRGNDFMPGRDDIPEEFLKGWTSNKGWAGLVSDWFYNGLPKDVEFIPRKGIDDTTAINHVMSIMRSFEPKHEHKFAACSYLLSIWFKDVRSGGKTLLRK